MKKRGGTKKSLEKKIRELAIFRTDPRRLADLVMKAYEIKMIYEDPEKRLMIYIDECVQKAIQFSLLDCLALLRDKLKYLEPEEAKQQLRKCMKEIGELKAERCKAIGAIGIP
jgi:hypothetical protein